MPMDPGTGPRQAAEECFRRGDLAGCLQALQGAVRKQPADAGLRIFLSQLLMVSGDWDRALEQLGVVGELEASALPMVHAYGAAVQCERVRAEVFAGRRGPLLFGEPEPWIALLLQSLALPGEGRAADAAALRAEALEQAPATPGTLNGQAFEWIADADSRLGPVLEVLLNGAYYWIPMHRIASVTVEAPGDVRDLVWLPAQFVWSNGGEAAGLIPARYPGSEAAAEPSIRLARRTEWRELAPDAYAGLGQKLLATDSVELGLLELRRLELAGTA